MNGMIPNFIGGAWVASSAAESLAVENPATREPLGRTPLSPAVDVDAAVQAAAKAFPAWRQTPAVERARVLFRLKALLEDNADEISRSLTLEHGKNLAETRGELQRGIENVEHACGIPSLMMGESLEDEFTCIACQEILERTAPQGGHHITADEVREVVDLDADLIAGRTEMTFEYIFESLPPRVAAEPFHQT